MKNLVKKACVFASALMVGGVSNASTDPYYCEVEYEVECFEPSNSKVDFGGAADGFSLLLRGAQLAFDKNAHPAVRTLGIFGMWCGGEIGCQAMGYGSPTKKVWNALGSVIAKSKDGKYADMEVNNGNGKVVKIRTKIINYGTDSAYVPVRYDLQPQEYNLNQNDYNYYVSQNFPENNTPYDYSQLLDQDPELPTKKEIENAKNFVNNNMPAPKAGTQEGLLNTYPQI